ncbi:hypothetical protein HDU93_006813, partial [Gonapodya sp. JEL0774]
MNKAPVSGAGRRRSGGARSSTRSLDEMEHSEDEDVYGGWSSTRYRGGNGMKNHRDDDDDEDVVP